MNCTAQQCQCFPLLSLPLSRSGASLLVLICPPIGPQQCTDLRSNSAIKPLCQAKWPRCCWQGWWQFLFYLIFMHLQRWPQNSQSSLQLKWVNYSSLQCFPSPFPDSDPLWWYRSVCAAHSASASCLEIHNVSETQFCVQCLSQWQRFEKTVYLCTPVWWYWSVCPFGLSILSRDFHPLGIRKQRFIEDKSVSHTVCGARQWQKVEEDSLLAFTSEVTLKLFFRATNMLLARVVTNMATFSNMLLVLTLLQNLAPLGAAPNSLSTTQVIILFKVL